MKLWKLLLAVVGATVLLGALVSTASARVIESSSQTLTATFSSVRFRGVFGTTDCAVTLSGSLHSRNTAKVVGSLIGFINGARLGACRTGAATILTETLPWHVQYVGFTGRLPTIESIRTNVIDASFRIREPVATCLARTSTTQPARGDYTIVGGRITAVAIGGTIRVGAECFGAEGSFESSGSTVTGAGGAAISVRLI